MEYQLTYDYLCPFARNAHEAVVASGRATVTYRPFALSQTKVADGGPAVFGDPEARGVLALWWSLAVRATQPEVFQEAHLALFAARHDHGRDINDEGVVRRTLESVGVDVTQASALVASGEAAAALADAHTEAVDRWGVFGVPTFIRGDVATFVRFMERGDTDTLARVEEMLDWPELNEFKRTRLPK